MPYFVFKIHPGKRLELIDTHAGYQDARAHIKSLRETIGDAGDYHARMVFAKNPSEAEQLVLTERPYQVMGEE